MPYESTLGIDSHVKLLPDLELCIIGELRTMRMVIKPIETVTPAGIQNSRRHTFLKAQQFWLIYIIEVSYLQK